MLFPLMLTVNKTGPLRVAILCDFAEERWPSMDLVGDMLTESLQRYHSPALQVTKIRPHFVRRFSRVHARSKLAKNADRLLNRLFDYPRYLRHVLNEFDLFHVIDHSYSHLVHELPSHCATVVTCHDLRTFRCLLEPECERRSPAFQIMTNRILTGLRRACFISCVSESTRAELLKHQLAEPIHSRVIPNGVAPVYSAAPEIKGDREAERLLGSRTGAIEILNVGDTTPRKRIDLLLRVFAATRRMYPSLRLIRVGGPLTPQQLDLAQALGIRPAVVELPFLSVGTLAAVYRRAALVLCPSEAEGFGLPLLESMACGTPAVASEIRALRGVGGGAARYAAVGDEQQWTSTVLNVLDERRRDPELSVQHRQACVERAKKFSWRKAAARTFEMYCDLTA
jgi:glycosyltransferase involved in cell wall biosynthesis